MIAMAMYKSYIQIVQVVICCLIGQRQFFARMRHHQGHTPLHQGTDLLHIMVPSKSRLPGDWLCQEDASGDMLSNSDVG